MRPDSKDDEHDDERGDGGGPPLSQSFGYEKVSSEDRRSRVRRVFDAVAPRYDLMNDLMSMGVHRLWKRRMKGLAQQFEGPLAVDLAGGTGDIARLLAASGRQQVIVADSSLRMMLAGRENMSQRERGVISFVVAEGENLPFADDSVDLVTVAFGLRNMTLPDAALREALRVLRPGGGFVCLEFSRPKSWFRPFYDLYSFLVIPRLGALVAREPDAYQYLIESIRRFPEQEDLKNMMQAAGFANVKYRNLFLGVACLHWGVKDRGVKQGAAGKEDDG